MTLLVGVTFLRRWERPQSQSVRRRGLLSASFWLSGFSATPQTPLVCKTPGLTRAFERITQKWKPSLRHGMSGVWEGASVVAGNGMVGGQAEGHTGIDFSMHMFSTCRRRLFHFVSSLLPALPGPVTPSPAAEDPAAPSARPDSHLPGKVTDPLLGLPCHLFFPITDWWQCYIDPLSPIDPTGCCHSEALGEAWDLKIRQF